MPVFIKMSLEILFQVKLTTLNQLFGIAESCAWFAVSICQRDICCLSTSCKDSLFQINFFSGEQGILMN